MKKYNPTSPAKRHFMVTDYSVLTADKPLKKLVSFKKQKKGRSQGKITSRHKGGGYKKLYREVIFGEEKKGVPGIVKTIEYDPFRTTFIALVSYRDGDWKYILAPQGLKVGNEILCAESAPISLANRLPLKNIPVGTQIHNIETKPLQGGRLCRSAGSAAIILSQEGQFTFIKMPSTEVRKILSTCYASIGQLSNIEHGLIELGKAGRVRLMGRRPKVRGSVMNPVDHPYGGGEGRTKRGTKRPKNIFGKVTGGKKTRKVNKYSDKFIIERRKKKH
ncbi:MAG: 50S ribosomal protein L2 [Parcubacteria group bacterium]|nr:50S ribosomal protein L2 [Parcubacteria group bacterium]